jgi:hypothetical protein
MWEWPSIIERAVENAVPLGNSVRVQLVAQESSHEFNQGSALESS